SQREWWRLVIEFQPALFVVLVLPVYCVIRSWPDKEMRVPSGSKSEKIEQIKVVGQFAISSNLPHSQRLPPSYNGHARNVAAGILASSLLFAINHASVWPTPIALFPLGLLLGYLAQRTQSLAASMVVHSLFNAVALIGLMLKPSN